MLLYLLLCLTIHHHHLVRPGFITRLHGGARGHMQGVTCVLSCNHECDEMPVVKQHIRLPRVNMPQIIWMMESSGEQGVTLTLFNVIILAV